MPFAIDVSADCEGLGGGQYVGEVLITTADVSQLKVIEVRLGVPETTRRTPDLLSTSTR